MRRSLNQTQKTKRLNRRNFIKRAAIAASSAISFPYFIPASALGKAGAVAPSNRINVGCIGVGRQGMGLMRQFLRLPDAQVLAVCDVKQPEREKARYYVNRWYRKDLCAAYNDFRLLLARDDIDAVCIASPDHWHVLHAVAAARAGKHIYLEKPIGLSLRQAQVLRDAVRNYNRVFQFGTQQRSERNFRFACELVLNGRIGKLNKIKVGVPPGRSAANYPPEPVPDWLDYETWLGPAPQEPYSAHRVVNSCWFHICDYSLGYIAGWGVHHVDIAQWANRTELTGPVEVEGTGVFPRDGLCDCAVNWSVNLAYASGVTLNFTDNTQNPQGVLFEGTDGWVFVNRKTLQTHPNSLLQEKFQPSEILLPVSNHHQKNFLACIKTANETVAPIEVAVRSDTICQLADIAIRLGRKLRWNPQQERFVDDVQAERMLTRPMRSPWRL